MIYTQTDCDAAFAWLALADARERGQVQGGPPIDKVRCKAILKACARHGMLPRREAVAELLKGLLAVPRAHAEPRCVDGTGTTHEHPPEGWLLAQDGSRVQRMCRLHAQAVVDAHAKLGEAWTFLPEEDAR